MEIRAAVAGGAPALGRVMVHTFLAAHRGQMPDAAWRERLDEWTPEVSAQAWTSFFARRDKGVDLRDVLLVADRGFTALHVGVLTANLPARGFYEAMGAQPHAQTTTDEEGHLLPLTVYAWQDVSTLARAPGPG